MTNSSFFSSSGPTSTFPKPLSSSEVQTAEKSLTDKLSLVVNAKYIEKVELCSGMKKTYFLDSTDPDTISAWVSLMKKMKVSAVVFSGTCGSNGYILSFFINGKAVLIGGSFTDGNIYTDSQRVMYTIDNYAELKSEFQTLQKKMGFPKAE